MKSLTNKLTSNSQIGKIFEKETISTLNKQNFQLKSTKSSYDRGIDFHGKWKLLNNCYIIGQCKCEKKPLGEKYIRELEGTLSHHDALKNQKESIGILVSSTGFSNQALNYHRSSNFSVILSIIQNGELNFFLLNETLQKKFPSLKIGFVYQPKKEIFIYHEEEIVK
jgi:predicted Mrr-cat superfamily restriction endonuclease